MLHELLFALSGHPGEVFVKTTDTFQVSPHFPFLHPSERATLDDILQVANAYYEIRQFTDQPIPTDGKGTSSTSVEHHGPSTRADSLYLVALQRGLRHYVLQPYEQALVALEKQILSEELYVRSATPLSYIHSQVRPYDLLFTNTMRLIGRIRTSHQTSGIDNAVLTFDTDLPASPIRGARVLDALHSACRSGVPVVTATMKLLYDHCVHIFWRQALAWMGYGTLVDPNGEFFVVAVPSELDPSDRRLSNLQAFDASLVMDAATSPDAATRGSSDWLSALSNATTSYSPWQSAYRIDKTQLPHHLPRAMAQSIFFIGKVVSMFKRHNACPWGSLASTATFFTASPTSPLGQLQVLVNQRPCLDDEMIWLPVITRLREEVTRWLWHDLRIGQRLQQSLEAFRHYFLLGHGDLWSNFLTVIDRWGVHHDEHALQPAVSGAKATWSSVTAFRRDRELQTLLLQAATGTASELDPMLELFAFSVFPVHSDQASAGLQPPYFFHHRLPLTLGFQIQWPLDLLLVPDPDIRTYQRIFAYLLMMRRTQLRVHQTSAHINRIGGYVKARFWTTPASHASASTASPTQAIYAIVYRLRWQMLQWIDGLMAHFQIDIIEYAYHTLRRSIATDNLTPMPNEGDGDDERLTQATSPHSSPFAAPILDPASVRPDSALGTPFESAPTHLDLDEFRELHTSFLQYLERGLLLRSKPLLRAIQEATKACEAICGICERWMSTVPGPSVAKTTSALEKFNIMSASEVETLHALRSYEKTFSNHVGFLFRSLNAMSSSHDPTDGTTPDVVLESNDDTDGTVDADEDMSAKGINYRSVFDASRSVFISAPTSTVINELSSFRLTKHLDQLLLRLDFSHWHSAQQAGR
ncbi:hypothetical protein H4R34_004944 [Dimargaris verticillata]|uniref:Spindle pole body component n=1 Tax=Dimargaris verticillata TaxID=2761393 RepID=A0A9W8B377_9FUNG|nr:hypothetical protein H4R34_004944 [Dimargaris verticillata]